MIDAHAHLADIDTVESIIFNAVHSGLTDILAVSSDLKTSIKILEISKKYTIENLKIHSALGIHPSDIKENEVEEVISLIRSNKNTISAIGEVGLDFSYNKGNEGIKNIQKTVFNKFLKLSNELNLPVIVHSRDAWYDCYEEILKENVKKVIFHWYSGPVDLLKNIIENGYFISVTPSLIYSKTIQRIVLNTPLNRIFAETDSPVRYRSSTGEYFISEPKDVCSVYEKLSEIKKLSLQEIISNLKKEFMDFIKK